MRMRRCFIATALTALVLVLTSWTLVRQASMGFAPEEEFATTQLSQAVTPTSQHSSIDLRTVDWATWVDSDPNIDHPHFPANPELGPFVEAKSDPGFFHAMGYALVGHILYASFSERQQAAVVPIYDNVGAQNHGVLIYGAGESEPVFVASLSGFNMLARDDASELIISQDLPGDAGIRGYRETHYRLQDNLLVIVADSNRGEPAYRRVVVEQFYRSLKYRQFQQAYGMTSPEFQKHHPYVQWAAGFQNTVSLTAKTSEQADGLIHVEIASTDRTNFGYKPQQFKGTWSLIWSTAAQRWHLDKPNIVSMPLTGIRAMDWTRFLETETNLSHPYDGPDQWYGLTGPFVASNFDSLLEGAYGYAMVDDIFYANLTPDLAEQAFVWLDSGTATPECGTFHTGLLVYRTDGDKPVLATAIGGHYLSAVITGSQLIIIERLANYDQDGKCGSSGFRETRYEWQSNHLIPVSSYTLCDGHACANSVRSYYYYLKQRDYAAAYAWLSPAFQAANPYDVWKSGFQDIISLDAETGHPADGWVTATLTTTLRTTTGTISKNTTERWKPIWDARKPGEWRLNQHQATSSP